MDYLLNKIHPQAYQEIIANAQVIEQDDYGIKVYLLDDGRYLKLFRTKRFWSSATVYPHVFRFKRNAEKLLKLNIPTLSVEQIFSVPGIKRHAVIYHPLQGITLRAFLKQNPANDNFLKQLGEFLATLHNKGIYFRSVHFGNIIVTENELLGLIDIADMRISPFPLSSFKRLRNFKHFLRLPEDIRLIPSIQPVLESYLNRSAINNKRFGLQLEKLVGQLLKT